MKKHCKNCNEEFDSQNDRQIYCSDSCKTQAYLKRKEKNSELATFSVKLNQEEVDSLVTTANKMGLELEALIKAKILYEENSQTEVDRLIAINEEMEEEIAKLKLMLSLKDKAATDKSVIYYMNTEQRACLIQCYSYLKSIESIPKDLSFTAFIRYCVVRFLDEPRDWHIPTDERSISNSDTSIAQYSGLKRMLFYEVFEEDFVG